MEGWRPTHYRPIGRSWPKVLFSDVHNRWRIQLEEAGQVYGMFDRLEDALSVADEHWKEAVANARR